MSKLGSQISNTGICPSIFGLRMGDHRDRIRDFDGDGVLQVRVLHHLFNVLRPFEFKNVEQCEIRSTLDE